MNYPSSNRGGYGYSSRSGGQRNWGNDQYQPSNYERNWYNRFPRVQRGGVQKKRSGCTAGMDKNGNPYVRGWKATRQGVISLFAFPYKGTAKHESKNGREWHNWCCKVRVGYGPEQIMTCLYDPMTRKVTIEQMGFVMNPKGGPGGYTGSFTNKPR